MKSDVKEKVLMVENPLTGKMINILPMLEFLNAKRYTNCDGGKEGFDERSDVKEIQNTLFGLYELRNTFDKMKEI